MKTPWIGLALLAGVTLTTPARAADNVTVGVGTGAVAGALVGGPVGAVVGAVAGGFIGANSGGRSRRYRRARVQGGRAQGGRAHVRRSAAAPRLRPAPAVAREASARPPASEISTAQRLDATGGTGGWRDPR